MKKGVVVVFCLFFVFGCKVTKFEQGRVPQEYHQYVDHFVGEWQGQFEGVNGKLIVSRQDDVVSVQFQGNNGEDIIPNNCESSLGVIKYVKVKKKGSDYSLDYAGFEFHPGRCRIEGRTLVLDFDKNNQEKLTARILERSWQERVCRPIPDYNGTRWDCEYVNHEFNLQGRFEK